MSPLSPCAVIANLMLKLLDLQPEMVPSAAKRSVDPWGPLFLVR